MSIHPFARKCDEVIDHLRDILANMQRAKVVTETEPMGQWWDWIDSLGRKRINTRITGNVKLGAIALSAAEHQATVTGGGGVDLYAGRKAKAMQGDPTMKRLQNKYWLELQKCASARSKAESAGTRALEDGSLAAVRNKIGDSACPGAKTALAALNAYLTSTYGDTGKGSGGGSGGGW